MWKVSVALQPVGKAIGIGKSEFRQNEDMNKSMDKMWTSFP